MGSDLAWSSFPRGGGSHRYGSPACSGCPGTPWAPLARRSRGLGDPLTCQQGVGETRTRWTETDGGRRRGASLSAGHGSRLGCTTAQVPSTASPHGSPTSPQISRRDANEAKDGLSLEAGKRRPPRTGSVGVFIRHPHRGTGPRCGCVRGITSSKRWSRRSRCTCST